MGSLTFKNVYLKDYFSVVGPLEKNSRLKKYDIALNDYYYNMHTFEQAEVKMQYVALYKLLEKNKMCEKDIDVVIGGDLLNQISATGYNMQSFSIPFLGVYSACATFIESLILSSIMIDNNVSNNIIAITSSHNLSAERQFRYPVEYGSIRPKTSTFTTTGAASALLTKENQKYKITEATIGKVINMGIKDANNMGAVMAPAAAKTLYEHLSYFKNSIDDYDLILTGDLGCIGSNIFKEYLKEVYDINLKKHMDAGCEIFLSSEKTHSGGSGPVCLPLVLFNKVLRLGKYEKILIIGTGSLHSSVLLNQNTSIPAIAHSICLEVL